MHWEALRGVEKWIYILDSVWMDLRNILKAEVDLFSELDKMQKHSLNRVPSQPQS